MAAAAKSLQLCPTLCDPIDGSPPGSPIPGILQARTLEWVATSLSHRLATWPHSVPPGKRILSFGSVSRVAAAKSLQSCPTLCDPIDSSPLGSCRLWDSPGKNTGVGCHFLLQCVKVKSEREVTQSCPTLGDPMDYSLPGSSVYGIFQARVLEWGAIAFSVPPP